MGRSAHEHSAEHIAALREKLAAATSTADREALEAAIARLDADNKQRSEQRDRRRNAKVVE